MNKIIQDLEENEADHRLVDQFTGAIAERIRLVMSWASWGSPLWNPRIDFAECFSFLVILGMISGWHSSSSSESKVFVGEHSVDIPLLVSDLSFRAFDLSVASPAYLEFYLLTFMEPS